jgi:lysophospholipase L1-like esterase
MITQVFIMGSSHAYGVGASDAGWADLIKHYLHEKMFSDEGVGEQYEVFNFAKSGETIAFVKDLAPQILEQYSRGQKTVIIVSAGGNNTKAVDTPDNYVSTLTEYEDEMRDLLMLLKKSSDSLILVDSNGYVDETKTNPKLNPLNGTYSYFTNARRGQFKLKADKLCKELHIPVAEVALDDTQWQQNYLYKDGIHPNQAGHQLVFESILPILDTALLDVA